MSISEIRTGVSDEEIAEMAHVMREQEKRDFRAAFGDAKEGLIQCCLSNNSELCAGYIDGELIAIFGLTTGWVADDIAHPWLALSRDAADHPLAVFKTSREIVQKWAGQYRLLCNVVPDFDEQAIRFLQAIGFQFLNETVTEHGITRLPFYMVGGKA